MLAFLQVNTASAQMEVSVTGTNILSSNYGNSSNGIIAFDVSGVNSYTILVLQGTSCLPEGIVNTNTTSTSFNLGNSEECVGSYCFLITGETIIDGETTYCYAEACVTIDICYERLVRGDKPDEVDYISRYCGDDIPKKEKDNLINNEPIYLVGYINQYPDDKAMYFDFLIDLPYGTSPSIEEFVYSQTDELTALIYQKGKSNYDVSKQNDIDVKDAAFI